MVATLVAPCHAGTRSAQRLSRTDLFAATRANAIYDKAFFLICPSAAMSDPGEALSASIRIAL